jgi:hypothetical protein
MTDWSVIVNFDLVGRFHMGVTGIARRAIVGACLAYPRHCEERLRPSNPSRSGVGREMDCFVASAFARKAGFGGSSSQ